MNEEREAVEFGRLLNEKILDGSKRILGEDMNIPLGVTLGGVFVPAYGNDYQALLKLADKALYSAKKNGKHRCMIHKSESMQKDTMDSSHDIYSLSEILGERNIPNVALQLDRDAFSYVYRYVMCDIIRNR